ncbi:MAG TPA: hypothetical protein VLA34_13380, partial [Candidatus Krumholzibacterium sp.]|nr:hypothetical protein [Candidatus Krumholzibacterium sp.]
GSVNHDFILSMVLAVREAEDPAAYPEFDFGDDVVKFHIYSTHPDGRTLISEGDGAGTMTIDDKIRVPVVLATALASEPVKGYGQYWLNNYSSFTTADYKLYNEFIWYDDQLEETDYRGVLPDAYHADGSQVLVWREGWDPDDCYMTLRIGLLNTDHAHNGLGTFSIYDDGALVPDKASATNGRELFSDNHHSVVFIQPTDDRKLYWGASTIEHLVNNDYYLYYAGDMSDPYLAQPSYRNNTVSHKEREFLLIKDEKVLLIMDRAASYDAATDKVFQVYLDGTPSASGDDYRSSNGVNDLLIHTAWPPDAVTNNTVSTLPLYQVRYPQPQTSNTFLHILKVAPRGGDLNASDVTSSTQSVVAASFQSASDPLDYLVIFSNDPEGDVPGASQFTLTYSRFSQNARIYVMNLRPNTTYHMNTGADGAIATVTVSTSPLGAGFSQMTDDNGIFYAQVSLGDAPAPAPTPDGVQMDKGSGQ